MEIGSLAFISRDGETMRWVMNLQIPAFLYCWFLIFLLIFQIKIAVAITQKAVVVFKGMLIDGFPLIAQVS